MPNVAYTLVLWEDHNIVGPFPVTGPAPTPGFLWVVRDVTFRLPSAAGWVPVARVASLLVDGIVIASTPAYRGVQNVFYETRDCRQTVDAGTPLTFQAQDNGWDLRVTGYQLTTS